MIKDKTSQYFKVARVHWNAVIVSPKGRRLFGCETGKRYTGLFKILASSTFSAKPGDRYLSTTEKVPHHRIPAHYEQLSEFERGRIIGLKKAGWVNRRIARHMVKAMRPLEDAGKKGWTMTDFSGMMVAVDLGPQQIGRTD
ncbi:hypothetical protein TNCV_4281731 [Trichonephila clavipes]|nr:hypothetical protein TNCV_4281731 [Trichonephila clavipes]